MTPELQAWADEILKRPMPEPYTERREVPRPAQKRERAYPHQPPTAGRKKTKAQEKKERESWRPPPGYKIPVDPDPAPETCAWALAEEERLSSHLDDIWPPIDPIDLRYIESIVRLSSEDERCQKVADQLSAANRGMKPMFGQKAS